jgi:hypothetical protein
MHKIYSSLKGFSLYDFYFECEDDYFVDSDNGDNDHLGYGEGKMDGDGFESDHYWGYIKYYMGETILFFTER